MRRPRPTYANLTATLALFVALGGTSYAVTQLPRNSVGTAQLRNGAVTPVKLSADAKTTGPRGPRGAEGPRGATGAAGLTQIIVRRRNLFQNVSLTGGVPVSVITLTLPPGHWLVLGSTNIISFSAAADLFRCGFTVNGAPGDLVKAISAGASTGQGTDVSVSEVVDRPTPTSVVLSCSHDANLPAGEIPRFERSKVIAIPADSIDLQDSSG